MTRLTTTEPVASLIDPRVAETIGLFGPTVQFLTPDDDAGGDAPSVMRGTVPPGVIVPLHSHADPETFIVTSGELLGLAYTAPDDFTWVPIRAGEIFHIPGYAKHAFQNPTAEPTEATIVSTARIARFFRAVGTPAADGSPSAETLERFAKTSASYGSWNASPDENLAVGLRLTGPNTA